MRSITFHPEAEREFIAAGEFYEAQTQGLGFNFIDEVRRAVRTIAAHPTPVITMTPTITGFRGRLPIAT